MSEDRIIYLYQADWCGHCKLFKPAWTQIKTKIDEMKKTNKNIDYREYEDSQNKKEIEEANVKGYPTIRMKLGNKMIDYDGPRDPDIIMNYLLTTKIDDENDSDIPTQNYGQCGGSRNLSPRQYKIKYMKYKAKYFKLLNEINHSLNL